MGEERERVEILGGFGLEDFGSKRAKRKKLQNGEMEGNQGIRRRETLESEADRSWEGAIFHFNPQFLENQVSRIRILDS